MGHILLPNKCQTYVDTRDMRMHTHQCRNKPVIQINDKWYCRIHADKLSSNK